MDPVLQGESERDSRTVAAKATEIDLKYGGWFKPPVGGGE